MKTNHSQFITEFALFVHLFSTVFQCLWMWKLICPILQLTNDGARGFWATWLEIVVVDIAVGFVVLDTCFSMFSVSHFSMSVSSSSGIWSSGFLGAVSAGTISMDVNGCGGVTGVVGSGSGSAGGVFFSAASIKFMAIPIVIFSSMETCLYRLKLNTDLYPVTAIIWLSLKHTLFKKVVAVTLMEWLV